MPTKISESEKIVMEILWRESPLSSAQVVDQLAARQWNEKTVKTFLNRLMKKGIVSYEKDGRRYLYEPLMAREAFVAEESEGFLNRVFKGDVNALLTNFVQHKQLSQQELNKLKELLDKKTLGNKK